MPRTCPKDRSHYSSDVPTAVEYGNRAITHDSFVISNEKELEIIYGSEKIKIPPSKLPEEVLVVNLANYTMVSHILDDLSWEEKWDDFMPIDVRQILLILSISFHVFTGIGPFFAAMDFIMVRCGYEVRPKTERLLYRRYRSRREHDLLPLAEMGAIDRFQEPEERNWNKASEERGRRSSASPRSSPYSEISHESENSRMRRLNRLAIARQLQ